jgi:hypothetical protein
MRRTAWTIVGASTVIAALETTWFYFANVAVMPESERGLVKESVFWSGVLFALGLSAIVSLGNDRGWWRRTAVIVSGATLLSGVVFTALRLSLGGNPNANTVLLGEPAGTRFVGLLASYALLVAGAVLGGLIVGGLARLISQLVGWPTQPRIAAP